MCIIDFKSLDFHYHYDYCVDAVTSIKKVSFSTFQSLAHYTCRYIKAAYTCAFNDNGNHNFFIYVALAIINTLPFQ